MSAKTEEAPAAPAKSKKLLLIVGVAVLVIALGGGAAWFYISQQRAAADPDQEEVEATPEAKGPPTYLPMDNMVVNLADPGGEKVAQIGITLELLDSKSTEKVKQYLPTIRSGVLLLVSQRTSEELLQREGKEKLAADILEEASRPFDDGASTTSARKGAKDGAAPGKAKAAGKDKGREGQPVQRVLFSSFIVQ